MRLQKYINELEHKDDEDKVIFLPDRCSVLCDMDEAAEEINDLLEALHDAINRTKGVVPTSAEKFYQSNERNNPEYGGTTQRIE